MTRRTVPERCPTSVAVSRGNIVTRFSVDGARNVDMEAADKSGNAKILMDGNNTHVSAADGDNHLELSADEGGKINITGLIQNMRNDDTMSIHYQRGGCKITIGVDKPGNKF